MSNFYDSVNEIIGLPFKENGRDMDGMDCYGVVLHIANLHGVTLPDWNTENDARATVAAIENATDAGIADLIDGSPKEWDTVVVRRVQTHYHMGIVLLGGVLHASRKDGVILQPTTRFHADYGHEVLEYYRWLK